MFCRKFHKKTKTNKIFEKLQITCYPTVVIIKLFRWPNPCLEIKLTGENNVLMSANKHNSSGVESLLILTGEIKTRNKTRHTFRYSTDCWYGRFLIRNPAEVA